MATFWTDPVTGQDPNLFSFTNPPDAWSVVQFGPNLQMFPGMLEGGDIAWRQYPRRAIDRAKGPSQDGQNPKLLGIAPAEFDLPMVIWTPSQLNLLEQLLPSFWPSKSTPGRAGAFGVGQLYQGSGTTGTVGLDFTNQSLQISGGLGTVQSDGPIVIQHPALALANITLAIVEGWTPPVRYSGGGSARDIKRYVVHCMEFRAAVNKPTGYPQRTQKRPPVAGGALPATGQQTGPSQSGGASPATVLGA